jgi:hypothetical protein
MTYDIATYNKSNNGPVFDSTCKCAGAKTLAEAEIIAAEWAKDAYVVQVIQRSRLWNEPSVVVNAWLKGELVTA